MKGFTLIEFIIYITVVAVILVLASGFAWNIIQGNTKTACYREIQQNGRFAMEKIARAIKEASAINSPIAGNSANSLSLEMADPNLDPTVFDLSDNKLRITQGSTGPYGLTGDQAIVSSLQFTNLSYIDTPGTIRVEMAIDHVNLSNRSEYAASLEFVSTISLVQGRVAIGPPADCWGIGGVCDSSCQYSDYGFLVDCYTDPGCSGLCPVSGSFYVNPTGTCGSDGTGFCYKMTGSLTEYTSCSQGSGCAGECTGTCTSCKELRDSDECRSQDGCNWRRQKCRGKCTSCDTYGGQGPCENQLGCSWIDTAWNWNLENQQTGYSSYTICEWY